MTVLRDSPIPRGSWWIIISYVWDTSELWRIYSCHVIHESTTVVGSSYDQSSPGGLVGTTYAHKVGELESQQECTFLLISVTENVR